MIVEEYKAPVPTIVTMALEVKTPDGRVHTLDVTINSGETPKVEYFGNNLALDAALVAVNKALSVTSTSLI